MGSEMCIRDRPILIAIVPVTVLVLVSAGRTTQALTSRRAAKKEVEHD